MATGGDFGLETIRHFNGSLFDDKSALDMTAEEIKRVGAAADLDWSAVDPSIFGTLFERGLDPAKRSQLGAHFTGMADIELLVDAVIVSELRREWTDCRTTIESLLTTGKKKPPARAAAKSLSAPALRKARGEAGAILHRFLTQLQNVTVLDPACGSGNFLSSPCSASRTWKRKPSCSEPTTGLAASSRSSARPSSTASKSTPTPMTSPK